MSKNRLLQIVNRLGLSPKDKTDLVNIIDEGGTGTNENEEFDYWNLENTPISLHSSHKIYKHTAEEIIQKGEIIDDLGENYFNSILFYYTIGTHLQQRSLIYEIYSRNELLNGIYCNGVRILLNEDSRTLKIIKHDVKSGYLCYQPYEFINKLPKIFYEDLGDIIKIKSWGDIFPEYIGKFTNFGLFVYLSADGTYATFLSSIGYVTYTTDDGINIIEYNVKIDLLQDDITFSIDILTDNLLLLHNLILNKTYKCNLISKNYISILVNGEYCNGTITGIKEGKLVQYDINFETGEITLKRTTDLELIGSEVKLDVCTAGSTEAARNLELLNKAYFALGDHFTVNIDAGIGVAKFIPETGGEGHITTAAGVNVHYTIGNDGSVVKTQEIDIVALYNKVEAMSTNE